MNDFNKKLRSTSKNNSRDDTVPGWVREGQKQSKYKGWGR